MSNLDVNKIVDTNVLSEMPLPTPQEIKTKVEITENAINTVFNARRTVENILDKKDNRLLVIVGPCSIHDLKSAKEYANRLNELAKKVEESMFLVMRVYFAKPRTTVGWKGFINDPYLDDTFRIEDGLLKSRELLLEIANIGLPSATEALDSMTPQYMDDLITWTAIGARTTESQTHREMSSGLSTPVGFKNGTDGNVQIAINALKSVASPHHFLGINAQGQSVVIQTKGNKYGHVILRGGARPNYDSVSVAMAENELKNAKLPANIMIDCSHGNSNKDASLQPLVLDNVVNQIADGNQSIMGAMIESNLFFGSQELTKDKSQLEYGVSITDACIDWQTTEEVLLRAADKLSEALKNRES